MSNKCMISLSFDDGRIDNYKVAIPILRKYGLKATFNITTGYVDKTGENLPFPLPPMSVENVKEIYDDSLFEIAAHGDMHQNDYDDISAGIAKMEEWLKNDNRFEMVGFASPGTGFIKDENLVNRLKKINVKYIRLSIKYNKFRPLKVLSRKIARATNLALFYKIAYKDTCFNTLEDIYVPSIPVLHQTTFNQIKAIINYAVSTNKNVVLMLHSIVKKGDAAYDDNWSMDAEKFEKLCSLLKELQSSGKCEVLTTMELVNKL